MYKNIGFMKGIENYNFLNLPKDKGIELIQKIRVRFLKYREYLELIELTDKINKAPRFQNNFYFNIVIQKYVK